MPTSESFRGLLLRHRGRTGLTQRDLALRAGVSVRSVQEWEAGVSFPTAERLQAMIRALLESGAFSAGQAMEEASELWTAADRDSPRMHTPFDEAWFAQLLPMPASTMALGDRATSTSERVEDWSEAPDTEAFVGRSIELSQLCAWVLDERCRLLALVGFGGIGKTILAARLAQLVAPGFERVYWRSLRNAPPLTDWLAGAIGFLSDHDLAPPQSESECLARLLQLLRARRCLLVLDNSETLFAPGDQHGRYRPGMEGYGGLFETIGGSSHQSCLILTSRESPPELALLSAGVHRIQLHGLGATEARALLVDKHLNGDEHAWAQLVERYDGNGLALKIVGETIREVYDGDIGAFLVDTNATSASVFGGVRRLLDTQADRLSQVEQVILRRLAIEREPITLAELSVDMTESLSRSACVEALETLRRRSFVERGERGATFTLQSMVLEYVTDRLVQAVVGEVEDGKPSQLIELPLIQAQAKDYVRQTQERLIGAQILRRLAATHATDAIESRLLALLDAWRGRPSAEQGYGPGNTVNLLRLLRGNLRGMDLSALTLRQVYLQGVDAQDANLAGSLLHGAVLDEAFAYANAVALSSDGTLLAAGTPTGDLRLWRVADRTPLLAIHGHSGMVWCVALSGDGRVVATGGEDGKTRLWSTRSGEPLGTLEGYAGGIRGVALSDDALLAATASWDGTIRLWNTETWQLLRACEGDSMGGRGVALSGDGRVVTSGGEDGIVRLWDTATGALMRALEGHTAPVWSVALSRDGRLVVSGGVDGSVRIWNRSTGRLLSTLQRHAGAVRSVAMSADGRLVISGGVDGTVRVWESGAGQLLATLHGRGGVVLSVALSSDGRLIATSSMDRTIRLWDGDRRQPLTTIQCHTAGVFGVALTGDGQTLASGGVDGTVKIWDTRSGALLKTLDGHGGGFRGVALSADGLLVTSASWDGMVRIWDTPTGRGAAPIEGHTGAVWAVTLSEDRRFVASGGVDGTIRVWDNPRNQLAATLVGHAGPVFGVALSGSGGLLASGGMDGTARLWNAQSGEFLRTMEGHTGLVFSVALSASGRLLASGSVDKSVRLWDAATGRLVATLTGHTAGVHGVALSRDGHLVVSAGADATVRVWETETERPLATLCGHTDVIWGVAISGDGRLVASGDEAGTVKVWDVNTGECLHTLRSDRRYQRLDITGLQGITDAQRAALLELGAIEQTPLPHAAVPG